MNKTSKRTNGNESRRVIAQFEDDGMTQQHFKDDCDINKIVAKYMRGEDISRYQRTVLELGEDMPTSMELVEAENAYRKVSEAFQSLPAQDRDRFENDPSKFLKYMEDPKNVTESYDLGYRIKPEAPAPEKIQKVEVVTPNPPPEKK